MTQRGISFVCRIAVLLLSGVCLADGEKKPDMEVRDKGHQDPRAYIRSQCLNTNDIAKGSERDVRAVIDQKYQLTNSATAAIHDPAALDLQGAFDSMFGKGVYNLDASSYIERRQGVFEAQEINCDKKPVVRGLLLTVVRGENGPADAQAGLFQIMGSTSRVVTPSRFKVLPQGPGDICFMQPMPGQTNESVLSQIWFTRDNMGVELRSYTDLNVLPLARALDKAIQSCPKKKIENKKAETPEVKAPESK